MAISYKLLFLLKICYVNRWLLEILFLHVIKLKINFVYLGDIVTCIGQSLIMKHSNQNDFGSTRKAVEDFSKISNFN